LLALGLPLPALIIILIGTFIGSYSLFPEIIKALFKKQFALDYIAALTILVSLITKEYLVGAVIALMLATGRALEAYGIAQAKKTLSLLVDRIPQDVFLVKDGQPGKKEKIGNIRLNQQIFIRKGEVIPLDGILLSQDSITDESSITGEPYFIEKLKGDLIRSGTINMGKPIIIQVSKVEKDSTYKKIIDMVRKAQDEKSPFIRLADRYSTLFTLITLAIAGFAFLISRNLDAVLAVFVIATPCPLIIATPIALLGGVSKAAKKRIIVKKLASLEALSKSDTFVFDKTGTITIGKPRLTKIEILDPSFSEAKILAIGEALERNSLHPIAKTIIDYAKKKGVSAPSALHVEEKIGDGISGTVDGKRYKLSKLKDYGQTGMAIGLFQGQTKIALLHLEDSIKKESKQTIKELKELGLDLYIFTGDKKIVAEQIARQLGHDVHIEAELKPEEKQEGITRLKQQKRVIAMVGDGINDAPALAKADVGIVFSNEEQTAASEAADIIILGGDFSHIKDTISIAKNTIRIALQSILWGIGLSIAGMILAALGLIPPLFGAGLQEAIDVAVIANALRASK
jgi:heavy metal translocating P-type ATPase